MTVFASGISMNALAKLLNQLLGWNYHVALWICSGVVLVYVLKGGLTSAIYTEVLQFFMIVLGFAPVVYLGLKDVGGWGAMNKALEGVATNPAALQPEGGRHNLRRRRLDQRLAAAAGRARRTTRWGWTGLPWCSASASCSRSVTGARTSSWCSAPWRPGT